MKLYSFFSAVSLLGATVILSCSYLLISSRDKHNIAIFCSEEDPHHYTRPAQTGRRVLILAYPRWGDAWGESCTNISTGLDPLCSEKSSRRRTIFLISSSLSIPWGAISGGKIKLPLTPNTSVSLFRVSWPASREESEDFRKTNSSRRKVKMWIVPPTLTCWSRASDWAGSMW